MRAEKERERDDWKGERRRSKEEKLMKFNRRWRKLDDTGRNKRKGESG